MRKSEKIEGEKVRSWEAWKPGGWKLKEGGEKIELTEVERRGLEGW